MEHRQRYLESLAREIERLQVLIEELLDISRLDLEKTVPQWQSVDLNVLLTTLAEDRTRLFTEHGLHLYLDTAAELRRSLPIQHCWNRLPPTCSPMH